MPTFLGAWVDRVAHNGGDAVILDSTPFARQVVLPEDHQAGKTSQHGYVVAIVRLVKDQKGGHIIPVENTWLDRLDEADTLFREEAQVLGHDVPRYCRPQHRAIYSKGEIPGGSPPPAPKVSSPVSPLPVIPASDEPEEETDVEKEMDDIAEDPKNFLKTPPTKKSAKGGSVKRTGKK